MGLFEGIIVGALLVIVIIVAYLADKLSSQAKIVESIIEQVEAQRKIVKWLSDMEMERFMGRVKGSMAKVADAIDSIDDPAISDELREASTKMREALDE
jgi:hypothetical protein